MVARCLAELDLSLSDLPKLRKTDERKQLIAWLLKKRTTVSNQGKESVLQNSNLTRSAQPHKDRGMARALRIEFEGAAYHLMSQGNHGQTVFRNRQDREVFLETLDEASERTGWEIQAYVLIKVKGVGSRI